MAASTGADGAPAPGERPARSGLSPETRILALALCSVAAFAVVAVDWDSPLRAAVTLAFLLFVPGLAVCELLEIDEPLQRLALATATSLAVTTLSATALLYAGAFSPTAAAGIVYGFTCAVLYAALRRRGGRPPQRAPASGDPGDAAP